MTTTISPNEPDVIPDYVDNKPAPQPPAPEKPVEEPAPAPAVAADAADAADHRDGECIPNVPDVQPDCLSESEAAALEKGAVQPVPNLEPSASPWMRWYLGATVLVVALFGLFIANMAVTSLAYANTLPTWIQFPLLVFVGACCLAVLVVCAGLVRSWLRLRAMRQVDLDALEELRRRAQTREDGLHHFQAARAQLEDYLQRYPLTAAGQEQLRAAGVAAPAIENLAKTRDHLVGRSCDSQSWLEDFRDRFQTDLDAAARARVKSWSIRAAGCVIASPLPLLDAVLILGIAFKMIKDLCTVYNVRSSRSGSLLLLNKAIVAAFIAGAAEGVTETAGGYMADELTGMVGEGTLNSLGSRMVGVITPKLGEGAINAFFIHRLGRSTIRLLQPLKPKG